MSTQTITPPSIGTVFGDDAPRARRTDPTPSQRAADVSAATLRQTKLRVLILIQENPDIVGTEVNDLYQFAAARKGWERVAWDTPRKRAGELVDEGYLEVVDERTGKNHQPEAVYRLTEKARLVLTLGRAA